MEKKTRCIMKARKNHPVEKCGPVRPGIGRSHRTPAPDVASGCLTGCSRMSLFLSLSLSLSISLSIFRSLLLLLLLLLQFQLKWRQEGRGLRNWEKKITGSYFFSSEQLNQSTITSDQYGAMNWIGIGWSISVDGFELIVTQTWISRCTYRNIVLKSKLN